MKKEEKILINYILYFITFFVICLIGISGVFADTTTQTFNTFSTTAENLSSSIQCNNDICVVYGVNQYDYSMNFEWGSQNTKTCTNMSTVSGKLSLSKTSFGINNNDFKWSNVYIVNNNNSSNCNYQVGSEYTTFTCTTDTLSNNFKIGYSLNSMGGQYSYDSIIYRSIDITCDTSTTQIIENNNQNTQNIINNNNENTNKIIENNKVCEYIDKSSIEKDNYYLDYNGNEIQLSTFGITDYINVENGTIENLITYTQNWNIYSCYYNTNKELISCKTNQNLTDNIPDGTSYIRLSINKEQNKPQFKLCLPGQQANNNTSKGILGKLKDLFDTLFSNDDADVSGLDNMVGWLPPGPVDSIINLPLAFFNALTNTLTGTCQSVSIPIPFVNQTLTLPCFDAYMSQYLTGFNTLWTLVGTILSVFILYYYLLSLYKWVDDTLTFRENNLPGYYDDNWGGGA